MGNVKEETIKNIFEALRNLKFSLDGYENNHDHNKIIYLRNFITTARTVTFIIQYLKSDVGKQVFEDWYSPWQEKMKQDEILKTFKDLRNEIEKQGKLDTSLSMKIDHLNSNDLQPLLADPPPFSKGFFIGDKIGGSGWEIDYGKGIKDTIYIDLPDTVKIQTDLSVDKLTALNIGNNTLEIMNYYYSFLYIIADDARKKFM